MNSFDSEILAARVRRGIAGAWPALFAAIFAAIAGCNGPANKYDAVVTGTVTIDGELAKSGTVTFYPVKQGGLPAISNIFPDGSYSLRTGQGDLRDVDGGTVESGDYIVAVTVSGLPGGEGVIAEGGPPVPGPSLVAKKYGNKDTSDLKRTVKPGPNMFVLELDPAEPESPADELDEASEVASGETATEGEAAATDGAASDDTTPTSEAATADSTESAPATQPPSAEPAPTGEAADDATAPAEEAPAK